MDVSCIIPCYNEEGRVGEIINIALSTKLIREIIIVDDGSTDNSIEEINKKTDPRLRVYSLKENRGKSEAIKYGIQKANCEVLLLLDSDLVGIKSNHLTQLITPHT